MCDKTGGRALRLGDSAALAQCLLGGVLEESAIDHLAVVVGERLEARRLAHPDETPAEREAVVFRSLADVTMPRLEADEVDESKLSAEYRSLASLPLVPPDAARGIPFMDATRGIPFMEAKETGLPKYRSLGCAMEEEEEEEGLGRWDISRHMGPPPVAVRSTATVRTAAATPKALQRARHRATAKRTALTRGEGSA
jgi:hypothetical protein